MHPTSVFSSPKPARRARTISGLLAAAALTLPVASTTFAQAPGTVDPGFAPTAVAATIYALLFEQNPNPSSSYGNVVLAGGDDGFLETDLQPSGVEKGSFIQPLYGSAARLVFTAVPERFANTGNGFPKILLGGLLGQSVYQQAIKIPAQNIVRIFADGTQDTSFNPGLNANNFVTSILPLANQKIVVGGQFTTFNNEPRLRIVRLNNDGSTDESFGLSSLIDNDVLALAESVVPNSGGQTDGKVLVAGSFNNVGGQPVTKLARLNSDGSLDTSFRPVIDTRVLAIAVQPTGRIVIGGEFTSVNGVPASHLARLNYDGSLDTSFSGGVTGEPVGEPNPVAVYVLKQLRGVDPTGAPNAAYPGKIYVGGNFTQIDGAIRRYLGVINPNGTVGAFDPGVTIYDKVQSIEVQPNGRVLVGETLGPKIGKNYQPSFLRLFGATTYN